MSVHAINLQQPFFDDFLDGSKTLRFVLRIATTEKVMS